MRRGPGIQALRDAAMERLDDDPDEAVRLAREALGREPDAESHYVLGLALSAQGDDAASRDSFARATVLDPTHADAWVALGQAQFERLELEAACSAAHQALRLDPFHPDAHVLRAWVRERRMDEEGAARDYQAAALVDPERHPVPPVLDDATLEAIAHDVLSSLHPTLQRAMRDVHIVIHDVPADALLAEFDPPARPQELLGCFQGPTLPERSSPDPWAALPATIFLFRCNLARIARDRDELLSELRVTLLHEIGHYLGLDEAALAARDLD
ncbi:MAG: hypothetical protein RLZZ299_2873 [Pseudomonadota bacterium]|jgi:predicted Zn-dependent protease with MMP-like domain